jgi:hypothetical protein
MEERDLPSLLPLKRKAKGEGTSSLTDGDREESFLEARSGLAYILAYRI